MLCERCVLFVLVSVFVPRYADGKRRVVCGNLCSGNSEREGVVRRGVPLLRYGWIFRALPSTERSFRARRRKMGKEDDVSRLASDYDADFFMLWQSEAADAERRSAQAATVSEALRVRNREAHANAQTQGSPCGHCLTFAVAAPRGGSAAAAKTGWMWSSDAADGHACVSTAIASSPVNGSLPRGTTRPPPLRFSDGGRMQSASTPWISPP